MKKLIISFAILILIADLHAQTLRVIVTQPPKYKLNLSALWNVTLKNISGKTMAFNVKITGYAKLNGKVILKAESSDIISTEVLNNNQDYQVPQEKIETVSVDNVDSNTMGVDYEKSLISTGSFPPGEYEICVIAIDVSTNLTLNDPSDRGCIEFSIRNFSQVRLMSPRNESTVQELYPVFTWLPPNPVSSEVNYTLSIYEILSRQSPYDASVSNRAFFVFPDIQTTIFRYPEISRKFLNGRKYAVQVKAYIDNILISQSDISTFIYKDLTISIFDTLNNKTDRKKINYFGINKNLKLKSASNSITQKTNTIKYGINSILDFQLSDTSGVYSNLNKNYGRLNLIPNIRFNDIPFDLNLFLPSDQTDSAQIMYNVSLNLNQDSLENIIYEIIENEMTVNNDKIEKKINEKGENFRNAIEKNERNKLISKLPERFKFFSRFLNLGLGFNLYPEYSDYTVSGIPVKGLNLEFNRNNLYFALAGPFNYRVIDDKSPQSDTYSRFIYTGRIGIGMIDYSHFFLTMMYANDKDNSNNIYIDEFTSFTPKNDLVIGAEGKLNLMNDKLIFNGEIGASVYSYDTQAPTVSDPDVTGIEKTLRDFVEVFVTPNVSTNAALFYKLGAKYKIEKSNTTIFNAGMLYVAPGYVSLGSPGKTYDNDKLEFDISVEQGFLNDQISAVATIKRKNDNLGGLYKKFTTVDWLLDFYFFMHYKNLPIVNLNYSPEFVKNDATSIPDIIDNKYNNLNLNVTYPFTISDRYNTLSLLFYLNNAISYGDLNNNNQWGINLYDRIDFNPLWISGNAGILKSSASNTDSSLYDNNTYNIGLNVGYKYSETINYDIGFTFSNTKYNNITSQNSNNNFSIYLNTFMRFIGQLRFNSVIGARYYSDYKNINGQSVPDNLFDFIFKGTLTYDLY